MDTPIRLFAFDFTGPAHLSAGLWRHPKDRGDEYTSVRYWTEYATMLENAGFDGIFFADNVGYHDVYKGSVKDALKDGAQLPANDPTYVIPAMAAVTSRLGFGVTASTTYENPYSLARKFTTLDHLTDGRVGWNVVTSYSDSAARNHGMGEHHLGHEERYARAEEFIDVTLKLWEGSWEDDAAPADHSNGMYADPDKIHPVEHRGEHFSVPGIHLCEPSRQRTPVIFQAGGSSRGTGLAAQTAEAVFMNATSKAGLKKQVDNLRHRAAENGRDPKNIAVLQMITVISAATDEEAERKAQEYLSYVSYDGAMARYSGWSGLDMDTFDPDVPLANVNTNAGQTMVDLFSKMDPTKEWTPRDIAEYIGLGGTSPVIVGGPATVADELQSWIDETGIDGFNLAHAVAYQDVSDFAEHVVPELVDRGLMRTPGEDTSLRAALFGGTSDHLRSDHPGAKYRRTTVSPQGADTHPNQLATAPAPQALSTAGS